MRRLGVSVTAQFLSLRHVRFPPIADISGAVQDGVMFLLSILLAMVGPPQDTGIEEQATRCGIKPSQLAWTTDGTGQKRAQITHNGDLDSLSFTSVKCLLDWAAKSGARVGFVSEPPPTPRLNADEVARIERECGLNKGTLLVDGEYLRLKPSPDEAYEHVDCALVRLNAGGLGQRLGFVGNEADPNAVLKPPLRYIAEGSSAQIDALVKAAKADKWTITRTATASDGTTIVELESGATMTNRQAAKLLDRVWKKEFGDIAFGMAPRKLSDPTPYGD